MRELEEQQDELKRKILIEKAKTQIKVPESVLRSYYMEMLKLEPQMLINFFVKEIVLFDDRIEIHFNTPIRISPDESKPTASVRQGFLLYREIKKMKYLIHGFNTIRSLPIIIERYI